MSERPLYHLSEAEAPLIACRICRQPLGTTWVSTGQGLALVGLHERPQDYDHEPDPVPRESLAEVDVRCDFCSAPQLTWVYPAAAFDVAEVSWGSADDWGACDDCHALMEAGDREGVVDRAMVLWQQRTPRSQWPTLRREMVNLHSRFHDNRMGPPVPFTREQA